MCSGVLAPRRRASGNWAEDTGKHAARGGGVCVPTACMCVCACACVCVRMRVRVFARVCTHARSPHTHNHVSRRKLTDCTTSSCRKGKKHQRYSHSEADLCQCPLAAWVTLRQRLSSWGCKTSKGWTVFESAETDYQRGRGNA